jgi:hypothetical protein
MHKNLLGALAALSLGAFLLGSGGCSSVVSVHPVGARITDENSESLQTIAGVWYAADLGTVFIKTVPGGELKIAGMEWSNDAFSCDTITAILAENDGRLFINITDFGDEDGPKETNHLFMWVATLDENMVLFMPDPAAFAAAVEAKEIAGEVSKDNDSTTVRLSAEKEKLDAFLAGARMRQIFDVERPLVLRRIGELK